MLSYPGPSKTRHGTPTLKLERPTMSDERIKKLMEKKAQLNELLKSKESAKLRKERTRKLIQLGGLVAKAGADDLNPATLLGAITDIMEQMSKNPELSGKYEAIGQKIFDEDGKETKVKKKDAN
jgi:hypothetical protein